MGITYNCINNEETIEQGRNVSKNASGMAHTTDFDITARSIDKRTFAWTNAQIQTDETRLINMHITTWLKLNQNERKEIIKDLLNPGTQYEEARNKLSKLSMREKSVTRHHIPSYII